MSGHIFDTTLLRKYDIRGVFGDTLSLDDAVALSNSGVFAIVIECVVEDLAKKITKSVLVPTIGIGASKHCDGQILVIDDLVGLNSFYPKFVKK